MQFTTIIVFSLLLKRTVSHDEPEPNLCGSFTVLQKLAEQGIEIKALTAKVASLEDAVTGVTANGRCKYVSFRAHLTRDLGLVTNGQTIIFNRVDLNIGNAFHAHHGIFTAPCRGTYFFSMTLAQKNKYCVIHLMKNNVSVEYALAGHNLQWDDGGVATVLELEAGDDVWVAGKGNIFGSMWSDEVGQALYTSFAGSLLHAF